jgi:hypothetical protein
MLPVRLNIEKGMQDRLSHETVLKPIRDPIVQSNPCFWFIRQVLGKYRTASAQNGDRRQSATAAN